MNDRELLALIVTIDLAIFVFFVTYWNRSPTADHRYRDRDYPSCPRPNGNRNQKPTWLDWQETQAYKIQKRREYYQRIANVWNKIGPFFSAHYILAWATVILTGIAWVALIVTENTLELTERAWVGPSAAKIAAIPQINKEVKISITVNNTGREPATDFTEYMKPTIAMAAEVSEKTTNDKINYYISTCFNAHVIRHHQVIYPTVGLGGGGFTFSKTVDKELVDSDVVSGADIIVVQGCLVYTTFNKERHSAYCFFYRANVTPDVNNLNLCAGGSDAD